MIFKYKIHCNTENQDKFWYLPNNVAAPHTCPDNSAHSVDLASVAVLQIGDIQEVITQYELNDKDLKIASCECSFDINGLATMSLKVPGTPGTTEGRYVAGGYAFSDIWTKGDRLYKVQIVDVDNILGYGPNTVVKTYHDEEVDDANAGWRMWQTEQLGGEVEIDPIGGYGFIPAGLYLQVIFKKATNGTASWIACDVWWGKKE